MQNININCQTARKLCGKESCELCFNKSFASHPKSQYWDYEKNGEVKPINIRRTTHKKYWFICDFKKCNHKFQKKISSIIHEYKTSPCLYCTNQRLCKDENLVEKKQIFTIMNDIVGYELTGMWDKFLLPYLECDNKCKTCYEKSFASHPAAKYWNYEKNEGKPRDFFKSEYWDYEKNLAKPTDFLWNYKKYEGKPRDFFKSANKKFYFNCDKCKNELYTTLNNITQEKLCKYCAHIELCKDDDCTMCWDIMMNLFKTN